MFYLLLVFVIFVVMLVLDILMCKKTTIDWTPALSVFAGLWFIISLICIPFVREDYKSEMNEFKSVQTTIDTQRESSDYAERTGLTVLIIDKNEWLVEKQTKKQRKFLSYYIPDQILELEPIK